MVSYSNVKFEPQVPHLAFIFQQPHLIDYVHNFLISFHSIPNFIYYKQRMETDFNRIHISLKNKFLIFIFSVTKDGICHGVNKHKLQNSRNLKDVLNENRDLYERIT
jgi:hypothetical protein